MTDLRYAIRTMRRTPVFTAAVILTVALTIAANTTIFSVVNAILLRPLPFTQPDRIIQVAEKNDKLNLPVFAASIPNFLSWREQTKMFQQLAGITQAAVTLTGAGDPEQLQGNQISPALVSVLGVHPILGRSFTTAEEKAAAAPVAMLGEGLWKRRFGGNPDIIGRTVKLNDIPTTVVGILPPSMNLIGFGGEVFLPLIIDPPKLLRLNHTIFVFGRLKPGVSLAQAQSEMDGISRQVGHDFPEVRDWGIHLVSLFDTFVSPELKTALIVLSCAVGFVLLIACANIANLLLARATPRRKEMAIRASLGAQRRDIVRQLLLESIVLAVAGGAIGLLGATWALAGVNHALPKNLLPVAEIQMDMTVLWFAIGLTFLTGLLFGLAPAWRAGKVDLNDALKRAARGSVSGANALRDGLAVAEIAIATVLLIGAGLLIESLANLERVDIGIQPHGLMTLQLSPPAAKYPLDGKAQQFYAMLLDSVRTVPGVRSAAISSGVPLGAGNYARHPMIAGGASVLPPHTAVPIDWRSVSPGYFQTMSIPLLRGRDFTGADTATSAPVIIVSQATARKFWGDADPIGQTLRRTGDPRIAFSVIGVTGDVRNDALDQQIPSLYYPLARSPWPSMDVVVRTDGRPQLLLPALRRKVHDLDPQLAISNEKTMDEWISINAAQPRLNAVLLGVFAAVALLIAALGIYGVLAYSVNQRAREIGLRMALGALPAGVLRLIVGEGMRVVLIGIAIGLIGGFALAGALSSLVFGVTVRNPATFCTVASLLAAVGLAACAIPARRASRVDPMVALREE